MLARIKIRNYRNFNEGSPIEIKVNKGVTFILGVNNVGKSNLIKLFYEFSDIFRSTKMENNDNNPFLLQGATGDVRFSELRSQNNTERFIEIIINVGNEYKIKILPWSRYTEDTNKVQLELYKNSQNVSLIEYDEMPIIWSLFRKSIYIGAHRTPFFSNKKKESGFLTQLYNMRNSDQFVNTWHSWSTGRLVKNRKKIQQLKKELQLILGFSELNISTTTDNFIIDNEYGSFRLDELGSGISHLIISLGNAVFSEPDFIFIDEPENSLHPKLQEAFVRSLSLRASYGVIATTHSIGLARTMGDFVYTLVKEENIEFPKFNLVDFSEQSHLEISKAVIQLGYSKYLNLGGSHILLVEGRTDIKVFKELLAKFHIENEVIVIDLGGAEYVTGKTERIQTELQEYKRLGAESYSIIIDSDLNSSEEEVSDTKKKFTKFCKMLGFDVFITEYRSTENYISQKALDKVYGKNVKQSLGKFQSFKNLEPDKKWAKVDNWKLFNIMEIEEIEDTKLFKFIEKLSIVIGENR